MTVLIASDVAGNRRVITPSAEVQEPRYFTWWIRESLMVFDADDETVERYLPYPDGFRRVELWRLGQA